MTRTAQGNTATSTARNQKMKSPRHCTVATDRTISSDFGKNWRTTGSAKER